MRGQLWKSLPTKMYRKHELSSKFKTKHKSRLKTHWWHGCQRKSHWLKLYYCKRKRFSMGVSEVILDNIGVLLRLVLHYSFSANLISHDLVRFPCQMFALNMRFLRLQWFFVVLIRCGENLALFLRHLIDIHSEKSKQFIRGPVVNRILGTKGKLNCLEHDYQE